ncbi:MAG: DUF1566 domain-containing protein [Bacteroidales bacterium]|nr:DUF1566 domain-containing protein [Bacteroidales bacterium]
MRNIWKIMAFLAVAGGLASCDKNPKGPEGTTDFSGGCEAVDLGLSVKWASYNVGATSPEEYGSYFAWGETQEKENYGWSKEGDYLWGVYNSKAAPKYGMTRYQGIAFDGDGLLTLQPEDDPATVNWGTKWRTPTIDEIKELFDETKCEWTWDDEKKAYIVRGLATDNSIFLPAAGCRDGSALDSPGWYGPYWSSSVEEANAHLAYNFYFNAGYQCWIQDYRYYGFPVRAVTEY